MKQIKTLRTTSSVTIKSSIISIAYYMIALYKTKLPSFKEASELGPAPFLSTQSRYNQIVINSSLTVNISFSGLETQTKYTIYVFLESRGKISSDIKTLDITTSSIFFALFIIINF